MEASRNNPKCATKVLDEECAWPNQSLLYFWQSSELTTPCQTLCYAATVHVVYSPRVVTLAVRCLLKDK